MRERAPRGEGFRAYFPICEAIVTFFYPHVEVALHDLRTARIVKIWNCWSDRRPGDLSNLNHPERQFTVDQAILGPYEKAQPSQGRSKSITAGLRDGAGDLIGLLYINLDVTLIDRAAAMLTSFSATDMHRPEPIYRTDVQQHLNYAVRDFSMQVNKAVGSLSREERMQLVSSVDRAGLFQARKSGARHISGCLARLRAAARAAAGKEPRAFPVRLETMLGSLSALVDSGSSAPTQAEKTELDTLRGAAAAELDHARRRCEHRNLRCVHFQQAALGTPQAVFGSCVMASKSDEPNAS